MNYKDAYRLWLESPALSDAERAELASLTDEKEIESRFTGLLSFGTAGLRGEMETGLARMNRHVVRHATQAFAEVVLESGNDAAERGIAVCCDCRNHSREFAVEAACVAAGNGIKVRLFAEMRPTPELSFAVRRYGCTAGINITASHNPKEYNGYKVYWSDGAQLPPRHAAAVAEKMEKLDVFTSPKRMDYDEAVSSGMITLLGAETDEEFLQNAMAQATAPETVRQAADSFKMVYTPFHGTGRELIPEALARLGVKNVYCQKEQMVPDGDFSTVKSPNPENPEGFYLCIDLANEVGADFILGSDPDADRVGVMVRGKDGKFCVLSGNQTGALLLDYVIGARKRLGNMPERPVALKTIVSTELVRAIAEANGVACYDTFTGFKFIAEKKDKLEATNEGKVIFSFEESFGYMLGDFVRDKDAVTASVLLAEMAAWYSLKGMTLLDALDEIYEKYGWYGERTLNLVMPGLDGAEKMRKLMARLREDAPSDIGGTKVRRVRDYSTGTECDPDGGNAVEMELSDSNVLSYLLEDGTTVIVRPSGTEPKVKVYVLALGTGRSDRDERVERYCAWAEELKN